MLGWPTHTPSLAPSLDSRELIKQLLDVTTSKDDNPMPNWQSSQCIGETLQREEVFEQFKNAIDSQALTDDVKLTYLKRLAKGKTKSGIAEFSNCGVRYRKAFITIE